MKSKPDSMLQPFPSELPPRLCWCRLILALLTFGFRALLRRFARTRVRVDVQEGAVSCLGRNFNVNRIIADMFSNSQFREVLYLPRCREEWLQHFLCRRHWLHWRLLSRYICHRRFYNKKLRDGSGDRQHNWRWNYGDWIQLVRGKC